ncbi:hypothetical protein B0H13DRAFT_1926869 [Mycena leptocephala]|nr:hypothetical protein B0H13DRAFT_1926869 [Mycena leptocephala]
MANKKPAGQPRPSLVTKLAHAASPATPSLPPDASLVSPPKSATPMPSPKRDAPPHRPAPQTRVYVQQPAKSGNTFSALATDPDTPSKSKEKETAFLDLKTLADSAESFDDLVSAFKAVVQLFRDYKSSAPTSAAFAALESVQTRLENHHEIPRASETSTTFSALVTKSVTKPVESLLAQVQAQHKAIQSLSNAVESLKTKPSVTAPSFAAAASKSPPPSPKPKPAPLPCPSDERLLIRCDGDVPEILSRPLMRGWLRSVFRRFSTRPGSTKAVSL